MPGSSRLRAWGLAGLLLVITGAVYLRALHVGFYSDDWQWLGRMNATLDHPGYVLSIFYRDFNPVLHATFVADWILGHGQAWSFHASSGLLHLATTAMLFLLCRRLSGSAPLAAAAALVWSVNVRVSEAVIWPAARGHEMATAFALGALLCAGSRRRWAGALACGLFVLGLLCKETALMPLAAFPLLLPDWRRAKGTLVGMALAGVAFVLFKLVATPSFQPSGATAGDLVRKIPFLLLRPIGLGDLYPFTGLACVGVLAALAFAAWWLRRGAGLGGLVWVVAGTLPVIPFDKLSSRYLYLPAAGWSIVLCGASVEIGSRLSSPAVRKAVSAAAFTALAVIVAGNAIDVQREIDDYAHLAAPYEALAAALAAPLSAIEPGQSVIVADLGTRDTVSRLVADSARRGAITKLIPFRPAGIDGLIELQDIINGATPRRPGVLARNVPADDAGHARWIVWDGLIARELPGPPDESIPKDRLFAARIGPGLMPREE